jgi:hypothetical protein
VIYNTFTCYKGLKVPPKGHLIIRENCFNLISPLLLDKLNKILNFGPTFILLVICIGELHAGNFVVQMHDISMTIQAGVNSDEVKINSPKRLCAPARSLSRYLLIRFG